MVAVNPSLCSAITLFMALSLSLSRVAVCSFGPCQQLPVTDSDGLNFARNFQFISAEYFLNGANGTGLDDIDAGLAAGGPPPIGAERANLDPQLRRIIWEFGLQEVSQIRAVKGRVIETIIPRPQIDLRKEVFAKIAEEAIGRPLNPPFDPYANPTNFLLAANLITYTGMVGLVGGTLELNSPAVRMLIAKLLAMEAAQNGVLRTMLYQRMDRRVAPYDITVAEFTNRMSELANRLGKCGVKDEGLVVPPSLGAENRTESNILAADVLSLAYSRTFLELLRIVYGSGDERTPGGLLPNGANGNFAERLLRN